MRKRFARDIRTVNTGIESVARSAICGWSRWPWPRWWCWRSRHTRPRPGRWPGRRLATVGSLPFRSVTTRRRVAVLGDSSPLFCFPFAGLPLGITARDFLDRTNHLRSLSTEPLAVQVLEVLAKRQLPRLLIVVVQFAQLTGIHSQLTCHLHLGVRQVVAFARVAPLLQFPVRLSGPGHSFTSQLRVFIEQLQVPGSAVAGGAA